MHSVDDLELGGKLYSGFPEYANENNGVLIGTIKWPRVEGQETGRLRNE